jgi:hypothetical protein
MSITIAATPALDAFQLSGDICRTLPLPEERSCGSVAIALSDGTLIDANLSAGPSERFRIAKDGAGIIRMIEDAIEVQWPIEWLTVSGRNQAIAIERPLEPLPLFPEVDNAKLS